MITDIKEKNYFTEFKKLEKKLREVAGVVHDGTNFRDILDKAKQKNATIESREAIILDLYALRNVFAHGERGKYIAQVNKLAFDSLEEIIKLLENPPSVEKGKFYVWEEIFAVLKTKEVISGAFAIIQDKNEITVIIENIKIEENESKIIEAENGYKIITFDMVLPFGLVGFLAKVSQALAKENISIFAISAFSTDHILVKESDLPKAIRKLEEIGFDKK